MEMKREEGWYWVNDGFGWVVAKYEKNGYGKGVWLYSGWEVPDANDPEQVDERRIERDVHRT